jgi:hypothetical protein
MFILAASGTNAMNDGGNLSILVERLGAGDRGAAEALLRLPDAIPPDIWARAVLFVGWRNLPPRMMTPIEPNLPYIAASRFFQDQELFRQAAAGMADPMAFDMFRDAVVQYALAHEAEMPPEHVQKARQLAKRQ